MLSDNGICQFQVLATCSEDLSPLSPQKTLVDAGGTLKGEETAVTTAFDHSANLNDVLYYVTDLVIDRLHSLGLKYNLYPECKYFCELFWYVPGRRQLFQVFQNLSYFLVALFKVTRRLPPWPSLIELDERKTAANKPSEQGLHVAPCMPIAGFCMLMCSSGQRGD